MARLTPRRAGRRGWIACMISVGRALLHVEGALLDPFWVGRRGDQFDQSCR
jgi:hypothetical protein